MIPNPEEDEEELRNVIMVGRPRPTKKKGWKSSRPPQITKQQHEIMSLDTVMTPKEDRHSSMRGPSIGD